MAGLSARDQAVIECLIEGKSISSMARKLGVCSCTIQHRKKQPSNQDRRVHGAGNPHRNPAPASIGNRTLRRPGKRGWPANTNAAIEPLNPAPSSSPAPVAFGCGSGCRGWGALASSRLAVESIEPLEHLNLGLTCRLVVLLILGIGRTRGRRVGGECKQTKTLFLTVKRQQLADFRKEMTCLFGHAPALPRLRLISLAIPFPLAAGIPPGAGCRITFPVLLVFRRSAGRLIYGANERCNQNARNRRTDGNAKPERLAGS